MIRSGLYVTARALFSSSVRLGLIGPLQGQTLLYQLIGQLDALVDRARDLTPKDAAQTAPLLEIMQGGQDRLYSRLFQS